MKTKLSVNLNKVALLRNQRAVGYPSVVGTAEMVIGAGAHGITVHPRPDARHIRHSDVRELAEALRKHTSIEFNIEGYPTPDFIGLVEEVQPHQVTLVPDAPEQSTSDHGWNLAGDSAILQPAIARIRAVGCRVAVFVDPDPTLMGLAAELEADRVELYTEPYAAAFARDNFEGVLSGYAASAASAVRAGLGVNAGHDLSLDNLPNFRSAIPDLAEVSIGHAITSDALRIGFPAAVAAYLEALTV